jgi:hypothetical protein
MVRSPFLLEFTLAILMLTLPVRSLGGGSVSPADSAVRVTYLSLHGGFQVPLNDLRDRFGNNGIAGASVGYKFKKRWMLQAQWSYLFGNTVKENTILQAISTADGFIIDHLQVLSHTPSNPVVPMFAVIVAKRKRVRNP